MGHLSGKTVANYFILEPIGTGGMAEVYQVYNLDTKETKAMKILLPSLARQKNMVKRFLKEAKIQYKLRHPNIIKTESYGYEKDTLYFVMDYIHDPNSDAPNDLAKILERGSLPLDQALPVIEQVCDALEYSHNFKLPYGERGIIHRDIKPSNILFDPITKRYILTDFGIAKVAYGATISLGNYVFGSPEYMSPEQCSGAAEIDHRTDIYSLGIVLYEMLTGTVPFTGDIPPTAIMEKHIRESLAFPVTAKIPGKVKKVIHKALEKDPQKRYPSALSLALAFKAAAEKYCYSDLYTENSQEKQDRLDKAMHGINEARVLYSEGHFHKSLERLDTGLALLPSSHPCYKDASKLKKKIMELLDMNPIIPILIKRTKGEIRRQRFESALTLTDRMLDIIHKESLFYPEIIRLKENIKTGQKAYLQGEMHYLELTPRRAVALLLLLLLGVLFSYGGGSLLLDNMAYFQVFINN
jgi:serine/threonine protein kinase